MSVRFSIHIVTWNSERFLPALFQSIRQQNYTQSDIIVVDNASEDKTLSIVEAMCPSATVLRNPRNMGFARAHNQAIELVKKRNDHGATRYDGVIILNPDIILMPETINIIAKGFLQYPQCGSIGVPLYKAHDRDEEGLPLEQSRFEYFDSLGIQITRAHQFQDISSGVIDRGEILKDQFVFGISGACCVYRWDAIKELMKLDGEFFDEAFFSYKEDIDVAWRLQLRGWRSLRLFQTRVYHYRGVGASFQHSIIDQIKNRYHRSRRIKQMSYRNHFATIVKNESLINLFLAIPWIASYETTKFIAILFTEPSTIKGLLSFFKELPALIRKRLVIQSTACIRSSAIRSWYTQQRS